MIAKQGYVQHGKPLSKIARWQLKRVLGSMNPQWVLVHHPLGLVVGTEFEHPVMEAKRLEFRAAQGLILHVVGLVTELMDDRLKELEMSPDVDAYIRSVPSKGLNEFSWEQPDGDSKLSLWRPDYTRDGHLHVEVSGDAFALGSSVEALCQL